MASDPLGQLLVVVAPANRPERAPVAAVAERVRAVTGESVDVAFVDQVDIGANNQRPTPTAFGLRCQTVGRQRSFVLLLRRWVGERGIT